MLFLKTDKLNNISLSSLQTISAEENLVRYYFNGFSIDVKKTENDIEDYFKFLKSLEETYEIIDESEFNEKFKDFFNKYSNLKKEIK